MSRKIYDYLNAIQKDSNGKIAKFARNIVNSPEQWFTTLVEIIDGNKQYLQEFLGYEPREYNSDEEYLLYSHENVKKMRQLALSLLKNIAEIVKNEKGALSTSHLKALYGYLYNCFCVDIFVSNKPLQNSECYYDNRSYDFEYLSMVMEIVDEIRIACASNECDSMNIVEQIRESTFASSIDPKSRLSNVGNGQIDLKGSKVPFYSLNIEKENQLGATNRIAKYNEAIKIVLENPSKWSEDIKNRIIKAAEIFSNHCLAEYKASGAVCDMLSEMEKTN